MLLRFGHTGALRAHHPAKGGFRQAPPKPLAGGRAIGIDKSFALVAAPAHAMPGEADFTAFNALITPQQLDVLMLFRSLDTDPLWASAHLTWASDLAATLMLSLAPAGTLGQFADGSKDTTGLNAGAGLAGLAATAASVSPKPVIVRLAPEMNTPGHGYGDTQETADAYVAGWRHTVDVFRAAGANNVVWCWCPMVWLLPGASTAIDPQTFYPGDGYVDLIALDGFCGQADPVVTPSQLFLASYLSLRSWSSKPFGICEVGAVTHGDLVKATWFTQLFSLIRSRMPELVLLGNWERVDSAIGDTTISTSGGDAAAQSAFVTGVTTLPFSPGGVTPPTPGTGGTVAPWKDGGGTEWTASSAAVRHTGRGSFVEVDVTGLPYSGGQKLVIDGVNCDDTAYGYTNPGPAGGGNKVTLLIATVGPNGESPRVFQWGSYTARLSMFWATYPWKSRGNLAIGHSGWNDDMPKNAKDGFTIPQGVISAEWLASGGKLPLGMPNPCPAADVTLPGGYGWGAFHDASAWPSTQSDTDTGSMGGVNGHNNGYGVVPDAENPASGAPSNARSALFTVCPGDQKGVEAVFPGAGMADDRFEIDTTDNYSGPPGSNPIVGAPPLGLLIFGNPGSRVAPPWAGVAGNKRVWCYHFEAPKTYEITAPATAPPGWVIANAPYDPATGLYAGAVDANNKPVPLAPVPPGSNPGNPESVWGAIWAGLPMNKWPFWPYPGSGPASRTVTMTVKKLATNSNVAEMQGPTSLGWAIYYNGTQWAIKWNIQNPAAVGQTIFVDRRPLVMARFFNDPLARECTIIEMMPGTYPFPGDAHNPRGASTSSSPVNSLGKWNGPLNKWPAGDTTNGSPGGWARLWRWIGGVLRCTSLQAGDPTLGIAACKYAAPGTAWVNSDGTIGTSDVAGDAGKIYGPTLRVDKSGALTRNVLNFGVNWSQNMDVSAVGGPAGVRSWPMYICADMAQAMSFGPTDP